jgi:glycosyltransferase involved in cell wall biosynthesis
LAGMRVLHLIDAASPQACPATLALMGEAIGRTPGIEQEVLLLGGAALGEAAKAAGIARATLLGVPTGRAMRGWFAVRRCLSSLGRFDLMHCWSAGTLTLATLMQRDVPRVATFTQRPTARVAHWLRMLGAAPGRASAFLPISATIRRELISHGVPEGVVHVLRPGLDLGRVSQANRDGLRESWGLDPRDRGAVVVGLIADPPDAVDAMFSALAVGIAGEVYSPREPNAAHRVYVLVHPQMTRRVNAQATMDEIGRPANVIVEPRLSLPWEVLPGCDVALATVRGGGGLSLLWAMAANVPIVAEADYAVSEVVEANHSALLTKPGEHKQIAHRITQLIDDPRLAWKLRDTARHECYSFFSKQRYAANLKTVYEQHVAGRTIDIPALESTGGLRFTGRA